MYYGNYKIKFVLFIFLFFEMFLFLFIFTLRIYIGQYITSTTNMEFYYPKNLKYRTCNILTYM